MIFGIDIDILAAKFSGVAGAFVSMRFLSGSFKERITSAIGGAIASYYSAPWLALKLAIPEGLSGFLVGLFGMAVCSRIWVWWHQSDLGTLVAAIFGRGTK
jgi:hypothetical protein